jgi:Asp/Glu/hydantoin racemase
MALKILLINPLGTDMFDQLTVDVVQAHLASDTEVVCRSLGGEVPNTPYLCSPSIYHDPLVRAVQVASSQGFDAVGISCCGDPALGDCKDASAIPVTAPVEAVCATTRARGPLCIVQRKLGPAFESLMPTQRNSDWIRGLVRSYGLEDGMVSIRQVPIAGHPSPEQSSELATSDPDRLRNLILEAMAKAADGPGVEQVQLAAQQDASSGAFFNCTFWGGLLETVRKASSIPIHDPLVVVAKYTEFLAGVA